MAFDDRRKALALAFARALAERRYGDARGMLSSELRGELDAARLGEAFESLVPPDWGPVEPLELLDDPSFPFVYVVLGGSAYSEALLVHEFEDEGGALKIAAFDLGRP